MLSVIFLKIYKVLFGLSLSLVALLFKEDTTDLLSTQKLPLTGICSETNSLNNKIRDGSISKQDALKQIQLLLPKVKARYYKKGGKDYRKTSRLLQVKSSI